MLSYRAGTSAQCARLGVSLKTPSLPQFLPASARVAVRWPSLVVARIVPCAPVRGGRRGQSKPGLNRRIGWRERRSGRRDGRRNVDRPIASDLSYECLQRQRREQELSLLPLHQPYQRAYPKTLTRGEELERISGEHRPLASDVGVSVRHG